MTTTTSDTAAIPADHRLFFLDWVRVIAFLLLILYHVGMYYVTWGWHVKSTQAGTAIEPLMMLTSPWRLSLLFLVSGAASAFMLAKMRPATFLGRRSYRLLLPLVFGMLVIVPPQSYCEVIEKLGYGGDYLDFMKLYVSGYHGFCKDNSCLRLPTWNHLWFVVYLWVYSVLLWLWTAFAGRSFQMAASWLGRNLTGWRIIVLPVAILALIRIALVAGYPATHALAGDWFNHANYFFLFVLGALLARAPDFWLALARMRWTALGLAVAGWAAVVVYFAYPGELPPDMLWLRQAMRVVYAGLAWTAIMAACGFARQHAQRDSAALRYLTPAVFPVYILHQTLIVVFAHALKPVKLAPTIEGVILVAATLTVSFGAFEIIRRCAPLRPFFGVPAPVRQRPSLQHVVSGA